MEIFLALVVITAVIIFGALISMGNERQRKAIDALREQAELWAIQDLRIKREKLAREARVDDPLAWLNNVITKVTGLPLTLQFLEAYDEPLAIVCVSGKEDIKFLLSPLSPSEIQKLKRERSSRLVQLGGNHPVLTIERRASALEISVLNAGIMFDAELQIVWKALTGQSPHYMERLWAYHLK